ncbi:calpain-5-like [Saccostrea echinata]|uniref:calpain-5-like n=1 Tax=Saccostrea echinata TaxID=191078 RepID=UPI002A82AEA2|nr:calpain-5-like [Saccostrea echinata]
MPCFGSVQTYKGQNYEKLKKEAKDKGALFIDLEFPPDDRSLFYSQAKLANVIWKRPKQICENPKFFVEGTSSGDVKQGRLGNCWFVAASSCLAIHKDIWHKVIPDAEEQEWDENKPDNYQGIFHFRFWRYGKWTDVVIDDFLPTINDELIYIHSQTKNEFWSALLEKAYAKLFGCYEALDGGELNEALEDFTGGVSVTLDMVKMNLANDAQERATLFARMQKEAGRKALMAASIPAESSEEMEAATETGLVKGHAYGVTAVKNVPLEGSGLFSFFKTEKIAMIRLRNPWGQGEWNGAFSDGSPEWQKISKDDRDKIGLTFEEDGEFWMTFDDYCKYFVQTAICRVVNTSMFSLSKTWHEGLAHGAWKTPGRAGGCINHKETFTKNPQFRFDITEDDDEPMFHLLQKTSRTATGDQEKTIGFSIFKVEKNRRCRIHNHTKQTFMESSAFKNSRSIFLQPALKAGRYVAIICTFDPNIEGEFLFRMYSSSANNFQELTLDKPGKGCLNYCCCCCFGGGARLVTQIQILKAEGLERQDVASGADPYCIISCEREKVRTRTVDDTINPEWNESAIFYRRNMRKPIKIQIWNSNVIRDSYLGKHVFTSTADFNDNIQSLELVGRGKNGEKKPGKLVIKITQSRNLLAV